MSNPVRLFKPLFTQKNTALPRCFQPVNLINLLILSGLSVQVSAADSSVTHVQQCLPDLIAPLQLPAQSFTKKSQVLVADLRSSIKHLEANQLTQPSPDRYLFTGNAKFTQPNLVVLSDRMLFDQAQQKAHFQGHVELHQPEILLTAEQVEMNEIDQTAVLTEAQYQILPSRMHGQASQIQLNQQAETAQLDSATLTACKQQENQSLTWQLKFKEVEIDQQDEQVVASNASLWIKGVPVLYTPYFAYSLADRASGFLFAELGSIKSVTQKNHLQFIKIPYFFNIAPNMDNTLTLIPMDKRGVVFDNEFRYLDQTHSLKLDVSSLQDQLTSKEGLSAIDSAGNVTYDKKITHRWRASLKAKQNWTNELTSSILWHEASDENFYADIPVQSRFNTVTQIPRRLALNYQKGNLQTYAKVLSYLRLRNAPLNYEKRPEIGLRYRYQLGDINLNIQSNVTDFVLPISSSTKPEALRLHIKPALEYQLNQPYGSVKATLSGNQTLYQMRDDESNTTGANTHSLFVPQFALKGGLIFERPVQIIGQTYTQTLEPEMQYLFVPYQKQSRLPLFDTGNRSLAFSNLFSLNRFTGSDRVGDANQITTALTTRFLDTDGRQIMNAGIGQIIYLEDRLVGLTETPAQTDSTSDIFIKLGLNLGMFSLNSTLQFTQQDHDLLNANSRIKYRSPQYGTLLANHVLSNQGLPSQKETLSIGGYTKIIQNWQLGLYINYDLYNEQLYHSNIGLRYDACCWATEFIAERTQLENGLYNDEFKIQFELKGLSNSEQVFQKTLAKKLKF
ncbi:LPS-assembly protein LptD @ Organic solvent tolerance protein precursor [hydrothermal vent metagenome]|uniref:LPS-assembly protein LptD @ Organic solvent tolerance protein n=1 Tax=hydrothermal vent metagenome TaxID=652676 RepID=A0A3B0VV39_9ZZZZ